MLEPPLATPAIFILKLMRINRQLEVYETALLKPPLQGADAAMQLNNILFQSGSGTAF